MKTSEALKPKVLSWHPGAYSFTREDGMTEIREEREFSHVACIGIGTTPRQAWANAWRRIVHESQRAKRNIEPRQITVAELKEELKELEEQAQEVRDLIEKAER